MSAEQNERDFLDAFPVFRAAPDKLVHTLCDSLSRHDFPAGKLIYSEGDQCSGIAFLISGELRVYKPGETGREITLYLIERGETCILNASCILAGLAYPAHAVAVRAGEFFLLPGTVFRSLLAEHELMREFVFGLLSRRLTTVMELIEEVAFGKMDERVFKYVREKSVDGLLHATHQEIANDLGTSREVVSRLLKDFERQGRMELSRNRIRIKE